MLANGGVKDYPYIKCKDEVCVEKVLDKAFETDRIISIKMEALRTRYTTSDNTTFSSTKPRGP